MQVATKVLTRLMVAAQKAHVASGAYSAPLYQPYIGLYTAISPSASPTSVMGDLTEATFTSYARQQITAWGGPFDTPGGAAQILGPMLTFTPSDSVVPEVIYGAFWADASSAGNLLGVDPFVTPISLPGPTTAVNVVPELSFDFAADYGDIIIVP
jgi:hypothetical protein